MPTTAPRTATPRRGVARLPARPAPRANAPARINLEITQRQLVDTMQVHRRASAAAFERSDRVRMNRLRQQGQYLQSMAEQVVGVQRGLSSHRDAATHLENIQHIYDDLADLRRRINEDV